MNKTFGQILIVASALGFVSAAAAADRWIHVRVDDAGDAHARVDIQVPVDLVSTILPAIDRKHGGHRGHSVHVNGTDLDLADLRDSWKALRDAKDGQYVTVRDDDSDVRISKSGGFLRVIADDRGGGAHVRLTVPVTFVDAVFAGGNKLDMDAIGGALAKAPLGELLTVDDEESHVRIWIDTDAAPAREDGQ